MSITLQLDQMSVGDKIRTMEYLWDDLCRRAEVPLPTWHNEILLEREQDVLVGNAKFTEWDTAKKEIGHSLRRF